MRVQGLLGADIAMQLDVCPPGRRAARRGRGGVPRDDALGAALPRGQAPRTRRSSASCRAARIAELRRAHAEELAALPFDGLALGGFSVGEPIERMHEVARRGRAARSIRSGRAT